MDEANILRWAAGARVSLHEAPTYDTHTLLQGALRHKITGRFLQRIATEEPSWLTDDVVEGLRDQQAEIENGFRRRIVQLSDIAGAVSEDDSPLAVLKGITSHVLTGREEVIRHSNDVDLMWADAEALKQTLTSLGYDDSDDFCRSHEYASLYSDGLNADVHRYFPVPSIPSGVATTDLDPKGFLGRITKLGAMHEEEVTYKELHANSVVATGVAPNVVVAETSLAVFLLCAHTFREYCHTTVMLPFATVRLGELCEIQDLMALPSFQPHQLHSFVRRHKGEDAMRYAAFLMRTQLGSLILSEYEDGLPTFPYDLWLPGFTIADNRATDSNAMVVRTEPRAMAGLVSSLAGSSVRAGDGSVPGDCLSAGDDVGSNLAVRALTHGHPPRVVVDFQWNENALVVNVDMLSKPKGTEAVLINSGDILYEVAYETDKASVSTRRRRHTARPKTAAGNLKWKADVPVRVVDGVGQHTLTLTLEWNGLLAMSASVETISLILGIRRETREPGGILFPLHVRRP